MLMADVPFDKLGLPQLGNESSARISETIQHTLYGGMIAPSLLLGGLVYAAYRNTRDEREQADEGLVESNPETGPETANAELKRLDVKTQDKEGRRS
jgi:hypothetical protein